MTENEIQIIVNSVLSSIRTSSLTIEQLTSVNSLPDDAYIEISAGRKISGLFLKKLIESYLPGIDILNSFGNRLDAVVCQDFFTKKIKSLQVGIGNEATSESEDGSVWGKLISIIQDVSSNSKLINDIEVTLSKASLFNNLGVITSLSDLNGVGKPGYYTYSKRLNGETINGLLIVSRVGFGGSSTTLQLRYELGQSYRRELDVVSGAWKEWEEVSGKQLKELGTIPMSGFDNYELETGIYLYLSEDNAPGMLYVNHPASNTIGCEQHRIFKGKIYSRLYNKRNGAWTAWSSNDYVMLDQLDTLTDPLSTISSYTVYYQNQKIGILQCFTNARADIVTQIFEGNWDIDVTGSLLSDCYVTEPRSLVRTYNISSDDITGEIPVRTWGRWHYNQKVIKPSGGIIIE